MSLKGLKIKSKGSIKKQIEAESGKKEDPRFIPIYSLKEKEHVRVVFVQFEDGDWWKTFDVHGPRLKTPEVGAVRCCWKALKEPCPVCKKGFDIFKAGKDARDKEIEEIGKAWLAKSTTIMACVVLDSSIEIPDTPDENQIKLIYAPEAIKTELIKMIESEQIAEADIPYTPFVIKRVPGERQGEHAHYKNSYFERKMLTQEEVDELEAMNLTAHREEDMQDVILPAVDSHAVQEWLDKAEAIIEGGDSTKAAKEPEQKPIRAGFVRPRVETVKEPDDGADGEYDDDVPHSVDGSGTDDVQEESPRKPDVSGLRALLEQRKS